MAKNNLDQDILTTISEVEKGIQRLEEQTADSIDSNRVRGRKAALEIQKLRKEHLENQLRNQLDNIDIATRAEKKAILEIDRLKSSITSLKTSILEEKAARVDKISNQITEQFLQAQLTHEKQVTELLKQQELYNNKASKNQYLFNQRRAIADQAQLDRYKLIDDQLIKFSLGAGTEAAEALERATLNTAALAKSRQHADDLLKTLPSLIGANGPIKGIKSFFTMLTSWTDDLGNVHSLGGKENRKQQQQLKAETAAISSANKVKNINNKYSTKIKEVSAAQKENLKANLVTDTSKFNDLFSNVQAQISKSTTPTIDLISNIQKQVSDLSTSTNAEANKQIDNISGEIIELRKQQVQELTDLALNTQKQVSIANGSTQRAKEIESQNIKAVNAINENAQKQIDELKTKAGVSLDTNEANLAEDLQVKIQEIRAEQIKKLSDFTLFNAAIKNVDTSANEQIAKIEKSYGDQIAELSNLQTTNTEALEGKKESLNKKYKDLLAAFTTEEGEIKADLTTDQQIELAKIKNEQQEKLEELQKQEESTVTSNSEIELKKQQLEALKAQAIEAVKTNQKRAKSVEGTDLSRKKIRELRKSVKTDSEANTSWQAYLKAKADLNNTAEGSSERQVAEEAVAKTLAATGMSKAQADAVENAENQAQSANVGWARATAILASIAQKLEGMMDEIALQKKAIDTRLYGYNGLDTGGLFMGSHWRKIEFDFSAAMLSPLIDQKTLMQNLLNSVDKGIARDIEQFAMLATIKDKIATTFNVHDPNVLRLIKIQDENTSAVRLGMEATLNEMLNQMYESTEYLSDIASGVRGSIVEAEALMNSKQAVEFEYEVQKWLGSMYSVGMSSNAVNALAQAIGQLAAGQIEGITSGGASNLLIMSANNSNMSISDILADGLNASQTNVLLNNVVSYMQELVTEANGNRVVQQQLAKVFGMSASDLKAITNIISNDHYTSANQKSIMNYEQKDIYTGLLNKLFDMADSMYDRTSLGEMFSNVWNNVQYSTAAGMAINPALYLGMKVANILETFAGGIPLPAIHVFGNGVDTKLTVANIMKTASMVTGFTQSLISMIASMIGNGGNAFTGTGLLKLVGIDSKVKRGSSKSSSGSGTVMNASYEDMTSSAEAEGNDQANSTKANAVAESTDVTNETLNNSINSIYDLLEDIRDKILTNMNTKLANIEAWTANTSNGAKTVSVKVTNAVEVKNNAAGLAGSAWLA